MMETTNLEEFPSLKQKSNNAKPQTDTRKNVNHGNDIIFTLRSREIYTTKTHKINRKKLTIIFPTQLDTNLYQYVVGVDSKISSKKVTYVSNLDRNRTCVYLSNESTIQTFLITIMVKS